MMPIFKSRAVTIGIFILIFTGGSLFHGHKGYAEMKQVFATSKLIKVLSDQTYYNTINVRRVHNHGIFSSSDPDWDKAKLFSANFYINPTGKGDDYNGWWVFTHQNGDQTFAEYDGSWKWKQPKEGMKWTAESKGVFTGGTGKFERIRGTILVEVEGDGSNYVKTDWEFKYELE